MAPESQDGEGLARSATARDPPLWAHLGVTASGHWHPKSGLAKISVVNLRQRANPSPKPLWKRDSCDPILWSSVNPG